MLGNVIIHSSLSCSFTKLLGYCSDEVYGKSAYSFLHKYDLKILAEAHYNDLNNMSLPRSEIICRIRAKDGHYVRVKTISVVFRNPWTKDVDYVATRSVVIRLVIINYFMILVCLLYSDLLYCYINRHGCACDRD